MKKWRNVGIIGIFVLFFIGILAFFPNKNQQVEAELNPKQELPKIILNLENTSLEEIWGGDKKTKYPKNSITFVVDGNEFNFSDVEIRGRGNSTWEGEKKPLQIKLASKENLFGLGKAKKWVLLANYYDDSYLRNDLGLFLANNIGENHIHPGEFLNLYEGNEYVGLYYLTHKIEIGSKTVNLKDQFGVLFEYDGIYGKNEECFYSQAGHCLVLKDAVFESDEESKGIAANDFLGSFNQLEIAAENRDFEKISEVADIQSFAEYFLVSEFMLNSDAYLTSFYFYKDGENDKIHAGPAWDFDLGFGEYRTPFEPELELVKKEEAFLETSQHSPLLYEMMETPEFVDAVKTIFREKLSGKKEIFLDRIDFQTKRIEDSAILDSRKWERSDFNEAIVFLKDWVERRFDFFEEKYGKN